MANGNVDNVVHVDRFIVGAIGGSSLGVAAYFALVSLSKLEFAIKNLVLAASFGVFIGLVGALVVNIARLKDQANELGVDLDPDETESAKEIREDPDVHWTVKQNEDFEASEEFENRRGII